MWVIVVSLVIGFLIGYFDFLPSKLSKFTNYLIIGGLFLLLFIMGVQIGANPKVIKSLTDLGIKAAVLAGGAVTGSVIMLLIVDLEWEE